MDDIIFQGLNDEQREATVSIEGPLLILAGAGSGKTRVLTHRIAYLILEKKVYPNNILAITFTNKAAGEMISRITEIISQFSILNSQFSKPMLWAGTFHSICVKILRREIDNSELPYSSNFTIYDSYEQKQLLKKIVKDLRIDPKKFNPSLTSALISSAKCELIDAKKYREYNSGSFYDTIAQIFSLYEKELVKANAMDFDDLLNNCVKLFQNHSAILEKYQRIYKYILIDEYQDTNTAQYQLVKLLVNEARNIAVVGDDFQSIYAFRGANFRNILNFKHDYPNAKIIKLERNYRSTQAILNSASELIKNNKARSEKKLWTDNKSKLPVTAVEVMDENEEIDFIISEISAQNIDFSSTAILYRTNAQSRSLEEGLIKKNIPYRIIGGIRFYDRKEIKDIIAFLRIILNINDAISLERIINIPPKGIGEKTFAKMQIQNSKFKIQNDEPNPKLQKFISIYENLREQKDKLSPKELIDYILKRTGYKDFIFDGTIEGEARWENIQELKTVASAYNNLAEFLERVALVQDIDSYKSGENSLTLMTLHSAKGLEFEAVFIAGLEEGLLPHSRSLTELDELEEERRLCYVGMTRAKKRLYLLHANCRNIYGNTQMQNRSRFIDEISGLSNEFVEFI
ncbi:MAG: ATP-dependent DNA helicase PcrA [Candidatus Berkelbacteria bacterium Licking1014_85]|uniref:DNA 3'-5' helicase n=1 Tax=Candidatus Berkelbacteria bacterium Licking1014_85 TaxID=2017148 RepID=A0A554LI14_9BACT|nr:MAG: ATP-dependent DNA helicase PcrA [Candidatus Berkelbacteria bacterium Licking1014_85]